MQTILYDWTSSLMPNSGTSQWASSFALYTSDSWGKSRCCFYVNCLTL